MKSIYLKSIFGLLTCALDWTETRDNKNIQFGSLGSGRLRSDQCCLGSSSKLWFREVLPVWADRVVLRRWLFIFQGAASPGCMTAIIWWPYYTLLFQGLWPQLTSVLSAWHKGKITRQTFLCDWQAYIERQKGNLGEGDRQGMEAEMLDLFCAFVVSWDPKEKPMLSLKGTFWVATFIGINLLIDWFT